MHVVSACAFNTFESCFALRASAFLRFCSCDQPACIFCFLLPIHNNVVGMARDRGRTSVDRTALLLLVAPQPKVAQGLPTGSTLRSTVVREEKAPRVRSTDTGSRLLSGPSKRKAPIENSLQQLQAQHAVYNRCYYSICCN